MSELEEGTELSAAFDALAAAYKRQFRLDLNIDSLDDPTTIRVSDGGDGDVKYLGTLRSNWLRRNAKRFGFQSIANELYPEVAGGAYRFVDVPQSETAEVQKLVDDPEVHVVTTAAIHSVGLVPEDHSVQEAHVEVVDPEEDTEYNAPNVVRTPPGTFRERFLDN